MRKAYAWTEQNIRDYWAIALMSKMTKWVLVCRESNTKTQNNLQTGERLRTGVEKKFELWTLREVDDECLADALGQDKNDDTRSVQMQDHVFVKLCQDDIRCGQHFLSEIYK